MFKFLTLGVILFKVVVNDCYSSISPYDSQPESLRPEISPEASIQKNDSSDALILRKDGQYYIYASLRNLYLGDSFAGRRSMDFASNFVDKKLDADYFVTKGMGAHKVHVRKLSWGNARRICIDEGGHLAVIRTESEEKILLQLMTKNSVDQAWVGYHDSTHENDWFSVFDEPLGASGWARWSGRWTINPNKSDGHCAQLVNTGGMTNWGCERERPFICKVSID